MKRLCIIGFLALILDQTIKIIIDSCLSLADSINVIPNFFRITYLQNTGAAWSILTGNIVFLILATLLILVLFYIFIIKGEKLNKYKSLIYGLIIGGILGNLIDRIRLGYVIDYFDFNFGNYNYPVFNLADICIVLGCVMLVIEIFNEEKK